MRSVGGFRPEPVWPVSADAAAVGVASGAASSCGNNMTPLFENGSVPHVAARGDRSHVHSGPPSASASRVPSTAFVQSNSGTWSMTSLSSLRLV
ncbi:MAG: hypothetical protein LC722_03395 [Actinobacteria bacterium]|nr:hypothetical protein [Actinomycetota bacterium]